MNFFIWYCMVVIMTFNLVLISMFCPTWNSELVLGFWYSLPSEVFFFLESVVFAIVFILLVRCFGLPNTLKYLVLTYWGIMVMVIALYSFSWILGFILNLPVFNCSSCINLHLHFLEGGGDDWEPRQWGSSSKVGMGITGMPGVSIALLLNHITSWLFGWELWNTPVDDLPVTPSYNPSALSSPVPSLDVEASSDENPTLPSNNLTRFDGLSLRTYPYGVNSPESLEWYKKKYPSEPTDYKCDLNAYINYDILNDCYRLPGSEYPPITKFNPDFSFRIGRGSQLVFWKEQHKAWTYEQWAHMAEIGNIKGWKQRFFLQEIVPKLGEVFWAVFQERMDKNPEVQLDNHLHIFQITHILWENLIPNMNSNTFNLSDPKDAELFSILNRYAHTLLDIKLKLIENFDMTGKEAGPWTEPDYLDNVVYPVA